MAKHFLKTENVKSFYELLRWAAIVGGRRTALRLDNHGRPVSYLELFYSARKIAMFIKANTRPGDVVAIWMNNLPQFVLAYFGAQLSGRLVLPINFEPMLHDLKTQSPADIKIDPKVEKFNQVISQLQQFKPKIIFVPDYWYCLVSQVDLPWRPKIVVTKVSEYLPCHLKLVYPCIAKFKGLSAGHIPGSVIRLRDVLKKFGVGSDADFEIDINTPSQIQPTGGTTGVPKGALLSQKNLVVNMLQCREALGDLLRDDKEVVLGVLPFFHIYGLTVCVNVCLLSLHGELIISPKFDPKVIAKDLESHNVTIFPGVNRMYEALLKQGESLKSASLKLGLCFSGAGRLSRQVAKEFQELTKTRIVEGYGLSEASPVVSITSIRDWARDEAKIGSLIGSAIPETIVTIRGESGLELPDGEIGEICVRGPQIMAGYYMNELETAETIKDGELRTGDMGYRKDGQLYFVDREKDMGKRRGVNIYSSPIEKVLLGHAAVEEAHVVWLADKKDLFPSGLKGDPAIAIVAIKSGYSASNQLSRELMSLVGQNLGSLYMPNKVILLTMEEFVSLCESHNFKNNLGKILKRNLKKYLITEGLIP